MGTAASLQLEAATAEVVLALDPVLPRWCYATHALHVFGQRTIRLDGMIPSLLIGDGRLVRWVDFQSHICFVVVKVLVDGG